MERKPTYGELRRADMVQRQDARHAECMKLDPKAYKAYLKAQVERHTKA